MNNRRRRRFRLPRLPGFEIRILTVDSPKLREGRIMGAPMLTGVHAIRDGVPAPGSALTRRPLGYGFASWRAFLFEW